jgi:hypothetical protein
MYVGGSQGAADRRRWTFPDMLLPDQGNQTKKTDNYTRIKTIDEKLLTIPTKYKGGDL